MSIPRIPTGAHSDKSWSRTNEAGKGSEPRNLSNSFRDNFSSIRGFGQFPKSADGHTRFKTVDGQRMVEITNEAGERVLIPLTETPVQNPDPSLSGPTAT
jgi:hypothetical protein